MIVIEIFFAGILGTSVMTLFSHLLEMMTSYKFNEAHLLNELIHRSKPTTLTIGKNHFYGWVVHYAIGFGMAVGLYGYYSFTVYEVTTWRGALLGFILGIIGIAGWSLLIHLHSNPPKIKWNIFFIQLMVAHVIFGVIVSYILGEFVL
mgnify:CR=1 FL=1